VKEDEAEQDKSCCRRNKWMVQRNKAHRLQSVLRFELLVCVDADLMRQVLIRFGVRGSGFGVRGSELGVGGWGLEFGCLEDAFDAPSLEHVQHRQEAETSR
jgi:hypothetical protein